MPFWWSERLSSTQIVKHKASCVRGAPKGFDQQRISYAGTSLAGIVVLTGDSVAQVVRNTTTLRGARYTFTAAATVILYLKFTLFSEISCVSQSVEGSKKRILPRGYTQRKGFVLFKSEQWQIWNSYQFYGRSASRNIAMNHTSLCCMSLVKDCLLHLLYE